MKKKKNTTKRKTTEKVFFEGITKEELSLVIAEALVKAEELRQQKQRENLEKERQEWHEAIGYRDFSTEKKTALTYWRLFCNRVKVFLRMLFLPKRKVKGNRATMAWMKEFLHDFWGILKVIFTVFALFMLCAFTLSCKEFAIEKNWISLYVGILEFAFGILAFIFSRFFRLAQIESDNVEDENYLIGLVAAATAVVGIVVACIGIIYK